MRSEDDLRELYQLASWWPAVEFAVVDVQERTADTAFLERGNQRILVDKFAPGDVDHHGARFHGGEHTGTEHAWGLRRQLRAHRDVIARRRQPEQIRSWQQQVHAAVIGLRRDRRPARSD